MTRVLTFAAGLTVVIASGVVYGAWTQRWQKSADLEARAAKLRDLPDEFGRWKGRPAELEPNRWRWPAPRAGGCAASLTSAAARRCW